MRAWWLASVLIGMAVAVVFAEPGARRDGRERPVSEHRSVEDTSGRGAARGRMRSAESSDAWMPRAPAPPIIGGSGIAGGDTATVSFSANRTDVARDDSGFVKRYSGDVVMWMNRDVWLTANNAAYNGIDREARLTGDVTAVDSGRVLRAQSVRYMFADHQATDGRTKAMLRHGVSIQDSTRRITAYAADYWPDQDSVVSFGLVRAYGPGGGLEADSLMYDARSGDLLARGSVVLTDSVRGVTIRAERYEYDGADSVAMVSGQPYLERGEGDTAVMVRASYMRYDQNEGRAAAWENVVIERGALVAHCDSVVFDDGDESLLLQGAPRAVQRTSSDSTMTVSETTGNRIVLELEGNDVRRIVIRGERDEQARAVATETGRDRRPRGERWISGDEIVFHVRDDQVDRLEIFGRARSRHVPPEEARAEEGINEASGDTMSIAFRDGRMDRVLLRGGVIGYFWPAADSLDAVDSTGIATVSPARDTTLVDPAASDLPEVSPDGG